MPKSIQEEILEYLDERNGVLQQEEGIIIYKKNNGE